MTFDWKGLCGAMLLIAVVGVVGPFTLILAWLLQYWATSSLLDARDRWDTLRTFAWGTTLALGCFLLADVTLHAQIVHYWLLSPLHLLGYPDGTNLLFLWATGLLIAPLLSFLLEQGRPRTIHRLIRPLNFPEREMLTRQPQEQQAQQQQSDTVRGGKTLNTSTSQRSHQSSHPHPSSPATLPSTQQEPTQESELLAYATQRAQERTLSLLEQQDRSSSPTTPSSPPASRTPSKRQRKERPDLGDGSMDSLL